MVEVTNKSLLTKELEAAYLNDIDDFYRIPMSTCVIIDFMSFQRGEVIMTSAIPNFGILVDSQVTKMVKSYSNKLLHIVFDSYVPGSLKGAERGRRAGDVLELAKLTAELKSRLKWRSSGDLHMVM